MKIEVPESLFVVFGALSNLNERILKLEKRSKEAMATIQEVQDAIAAEKAEVHKPNSIRCMPTSPRCKIRSPRVLPLPPSNWKN